MTEYRLTMQPPKMVGYYVLNEKSYGRITWHWSARPAWWHRFCCRIFFGWTWVDA